MIAKSRIRLHTAEQELTEIRRREENDRALKHRADGLLFQCQIRKAHRYDWTRRYKAAMAAPQDSETALEVSLASDFIPLVRGHFASVFCHTAFLYLPLLVCSQSGYKLRSSRRNSIWYSLCDEQTYD